MINFATESHEDIGDYGIPLPKPNKNFAVRLNNSIDLGANTESGRTFDKQVYAYNFPSLLK